jgi:hypothetical protein
MRQFPQLRSGAQVQFPLTRRMEFRTLRTAALDGSSLARADAKARRMVWRFPLRNMSEPEWQSLLMLHAECEGSRKEFLFADPTDNLLAESEDLSRPVWQKDAGISVVGSQGDPFGGNRGWLIQNTSSEFAGVSQATALPGSYTTCLSVYARSVAGSTLRLMRESGSEVLARCNAARIGCVRCPAAPAARETAFIGCCWSRERQSLFTEYRLTGSVGPLVTGLPIAVPEYMRTRGSRMKSWDWKQRTAA